MWLLALSRNYVRFAWLPWFTRENYKDFSVFEVVSDGPAEGANAAQELKKKTENPGTLFQVSAAASAPAPPTPSPPIRSISLPPLVTERVAEGRREGCAPLLQLMHLTDILHQRQQNLEVSGTTENTPRSFCSSFARLQPSMGFELFESRFIRIYFFLSITFVGADPICLENNNKRKDACVPDRSIVADPVRMGGCVREVFIFLFCFWKCPHLLPQQHRERHNMEVGGAEYPAKCRQWGQTGRSRLVWWMERVKSLWVMLMITHRLSGL